MRYRITGRVQGVGFRFFARTAARRLGVQGWVRNCADGSVEALAVGSQDQLQAFEEALRRGPAAGHVSAVEASAGTGEVAGDTFEIVY